MSSDVVFIARSRFGKQIRLTETIWHEKIRREHAEFAHRGEYLEEIRKAVEDPEIIVEGWSRELLALRLCEIAPKSPKYLCVVYRELNEEGFVITAFFISRVEKLLRRTARWRRT